MNTISCLQYIFINADTPAITQTSWHSKGNRHLLILPTFLEQEKWITHRWCLQVASLLCMCVCSMASFVLCRKLVVHTVETNPPEYHQLYDMLSASCPVHNTHQKYGGKGGFFRSWRLIFGWEGTLTSFLSPPMWTVIVLSLSCFCTGVFLAVGAGWVL